MNDAYAAHIASELKRIADIMEARWAEDHQPAPEPELVEVDDYDDWRIGY